MKMKMDGYSVVNSCIKILEKLKLTVQQLERERERDAITHPTSKYTSTIIDMYSFPRGWRFNFSLLQLLNSKEEEKKLKAKTYMRGDNHKEENQS